MLNQVEITDSVDRTLREIQQHYPTPFVALDVAHNMVEYRSKPSVSGWQLLVRNLLPEGWADWFLHLWMVRMLEIYGVDACREEMRHLNKLLDEDRKSGLTGWRCPITEKQLALCEQFWFPRQTIGGER